MLVTMKRKQQSCHGGGGGGDGVAWLRGPLLGKGGFGSVYIANSRRQSSGYYPQVMAVKSAEVSVSSTLQKEREVLNNLIGCPTILRCYGEETTCSKDGEMVYNVLLEYAPGGTLADLIKKCNGCGLQESDVKRYTRFLLMGLNHIHECGYVHCDLKPDNVLLVPSKSNKLVSKIGDFGLAKRSKLSKKQKFDPYLRGTPMYLAPEVLVGNVQEPPSDIWALGCIVLEMLTGKPTWDMKSDFRIDDLMHRICDRYELPKIPTEISKEGREFLKRCFVKNPMFRFTAEMLLTLPFVQGLEEINELEEVSDAPDINLSLALYKADDDDDDDDDDVDDEFSSSSFSDDWSFTEGDSQNSSWPEDEEYVNVQAAEEESWRELKRQKLFTNEGGNCFVIPAGV